MTTVFVLTDIKGTRYFTLFEQPEGEKKTGIFLHLLKALLN